MWIVLWDPFVMKVLVKKRFVGSVNSVQDPLEITEMRFSMEKKKSETLDVDCIVAVGPTYENAKCQNTEIEMLSKRVLSVL